MTLAARSAGAKRRPLTGAGRPGTTARRTARRRGEPTAPPRGAAHDPGVGSGALHKLWGTGRGRLPASDRRTQILAAALEVFAEQGFHGTRTRELAQRAGVSEALVFRHFPTKEALIRAIIERVAMPERVRDLETRLAR